MTGRKRAQVVEVDADGLTWIKSSTSSNTAQTCLEVASAGDRIIVRCSRNRAGFHLNHSGATWRDLLNWLQVRD